ncbi:O-antigen ligase family protein [Pelagibacteraceae bacterium]|nr:O-antigen ligase family protein [Pelagibacteraceae bacterium]
MNIDIRIASLLIILLPIAIATGPFLPDLIASILAIYYLFITLKFKNYDFLKNKIIVILLIFSLYILLRSIFSDNILLSLESSLFYSRFIFFSLAIAYIVKKNKNVLHLFSYSIIFSLLFVVLDAYFQIIFGRDIFGVSNPNVDGSLFINGNFHGQLTGIFGDEQILGSYIARMMPLAFAFAILLNKKIYIALLIFLIIISDVAIYLSGERSAFFLLIFTLILIISLTQRWKKIRFFSFIISIILIFIISYFNSQSADRMFLKTLKQLGLENLIFIKDYENETNNQKLLNNKIIEVTNECFVKDIQINKTLQPHQTRTDNEILNDCKNIAKKEFEPKKTSISDNIPQKDRIIIFSSHHENHYFSALKMFRENFLFGIGPKLFRIKCSEEKYKPFENVKVEDVCSTHPHNTYIQLLSETGIIGFLLIFSLFILICYKFFRQFINIIFFRKYLTSDIEICILVSLFIFLFPLIPTGSAFNNWLSVLHYMGLGFYFSLKGKQYV